MVAISPGSRILRLEKEFSMLKYLVVLAGLTAGIFADPADAQAGFFRKKNKCHGSHSHSVPMTTCCR